MPMLLCRYEYPKTTPINHEKCDKSDE